MSFFCSVLKRPLANADVKNDSERAIKDRKKRHMIQLELKHILSIKLVSNTKKKTL